jgi:hypothetical protein
MQSPLKRVVSIPLLALTFLCYSSRAHQSEANPTRRTSFVFAYVQNACGPTDGPALEFYFTTKKSQFGKYDEPFIEISINENLPGSVPRDYSIKSDKYPVLASRCLSKERCDAATSGTLHFSAFKPGKSATGEYELHFQNGEVERNNFDATWQVAKSPMCG